MSGFVVMETVGALQGRRVIEPVHQPAPERWQACGPYGRSVTVAAAVSSGVYRWPAKCGREGVVFVSCRLFHGLERCEECAG